MTPQIDRLGITSTVLRISTHIHGVFEEIDGKMFILRVNLGMWPPINRLGKTSTVLRVWIHIYGVSQEIDEKTCTLNLQLLHNTKRPTKWSGHAKMIDPPKRTSTYKRPFTREGNYLVLFCLLWSYFPVTPFFSWNFCLQLVKY